MAIVKTGPEGVKDRHVWFIVSRLEKLEREDRENVRHICE